MKRLRPFFPYYGSKYRLASAYPPPRHQQLVEPFAGGAGYATLWNGLQVLLYDLNPVVAGLWDYLIHVRGSELRALPDVVETVEDLQWPQEARWLIGFWLNTAQTYPANGPSSWARSGLWPGKFWGARVRDRLAWQVEQIRHWRITCGSWRSIATDPERERTWFIDPPYSGPPGEHYRRFRLSGGEYADLGRWCMTLRGQVIACEAEGATWLPFRPFRDAAALKGRSAEVFWTNDGPRGTGQQLQLMTP